jgi:uncharacterized protein (UPF0333 family)
MRKMVARRLQGTRGQSILEYLVIVTVLLLAILGIRLIVQQQSNAMLVEAGNKVGQATSQLQAYVVQAR